MLKSVDLECSVVAVTDDVNQLQDDDNQEKYISKLRNANPLKVYYTNDERIKVIVDILYQEISSWRATKFKSPTATKQTIEVIILNLYRADLMDQFVRYARGKNHYTRNKKFGPRNLSYAMVIAVTDGMEDLGYIKTVKKGRNFYNDRTRGSQTRMKATKKLIGLFHDHQIKEPDFISEADRDPIQLTDKIEIDTEEGTIEKRIYYNFGKNNHIRQMESDVLRYNEFVSDNKISLKLNYEDKVNYNFLFNISKKFYTNRLSIVSLIPSQYYSLQYYYNTSNPIYYSIPQYRPYIPPPHITCTDSYKVNTDIVLNDIEGLVIFVLEKQYEHHQNLRFAQSIGDENLEVEIYSKAKMEFNLETIGIDTLIVRLNRECLYRVFSRKSFDKGGRFYGPLYQSFPENTRRNLYINDEPTVELDFKAHHIRMLYHKKGRSCEGDPYADCAGKKYKKIFKTALLVSINARTERKAIRAIPEQLKKKGISLDYPLDQIIPTIKKAHPDISEYLCSDMGIALQNKDSRIMNNILMRLLDQNILGLPIHDSIIVQERHEQVLREIMLEEYKKEMGFSTEVEKK